MTPCPHGDHPACCIDCLDGKPPERPNQPASVEVASLPFASRYPGHCAGCNLPIHEGQTIVRMADNTYQHHTCGGPS